MNANFCYHYYSHYYMNQLYVILSTENYCLLDVNSICAVNLILSKYGPSLSITVPRLK